MIKIKNRFTGKVIYRGDFDSLKDCVEDAVKNEADLREAYLHGADLREAYLYRADLYRAYLHGADLYRAKKIMQWQAPQGEKRICYSVKHDSCVMHKMGCFWGNTEEAVTAIREKYGENSLYEKLCFLNAHALEMEQ